MTGAGTEGDGETGVWAVSNPNRPDPLITAEKVAREVQRLGAVVNVGNMGISRGLGLDAANCLG